MDDSNQKIKDWAVRTLAVVGILTILFFGGWAAPIVVENIPESYSNLASLAATVVRKTLPSERIVLSPDSQTVHSGDRVTISFEHQNKETDGSYTFSYECREGVHFENVFSNGDGKMIFCNKLYNFVNEDNSLFLRAISTKQNNIEVPIYLSFIRNNTKRVALRSKSKINIVNQNIENLSNL
jgi:hypothetical protein